MRLIKLKDKMEAFPVYVKMRRDSLSEMQDEIGENKSPEELQIAAEKIAQERLLGTNQEIFLFESSSNTIVGFAEVLLEEECFPEEDLPEVCMKILSFYINPNDRLQKWGTQFFKLLREWGRDQKAALIEMEVPISLTYANNFLAEQGLELAASGDKNCYRTFV
ncbi:MAG: hypothetical protein JWO53_447 [Chlamydiia bacterium]|nr:hypothetical protein [Chlamydiia bacterium]